MGKNLKPLGVGVDGRGSRKRYRRGKRQPLPYFVRLALTCIGICALGVMVVLGVSRFSAPYQHQKIQERQIAALQSTLNSENASNDQLQHQLDSLNTQEGIEAAARAQRFVEPGEVLLNVSASPAGPTVTTPDESFGAKLKRAWDGITGK